MGSLFDTYKTSKDLEKDGIWLKFGPSKVLIARSGGDNTDWYKELHNQVTKAGKGPFEGLETDDKVNMIKKCYCKAVIRDHKIKNDDGEWISGVEIEENGEVKVVDFTPENMEKCLTQLPDYFVDLQKWSDDYKTFRQAQIKEQEKNL